MAKDMHIIGNYAYFNAYVEGLAIINISNPVNPLFLGYKHLIGNANGIFVRDDLLEGANFNK